MNLVFVILNYNSINDTNEAIEYIKKNTDTSDYHVVIVDNASPNGDAERLEELYANEDRVTIIKSDENLGFAKGNNIGFRYARDFLRPEFIVMMNSDVLLLETRLFSKLQENFGKYNFSVLGPMIINMGLEAKSNPADCFLNTAEDVDIQIRKNRRNILIAKTGLYGIKDLIVRLIKKQGVCDYKTFCNIQQDVRLAGCVWIFSRRYITKYDGIDDRTFMYHEEEVLFHHMKNDGEKMLYAPDIPFFHKGEASTKTVHKTNSNRVLFNCTQSIKSLQVVKDVIADSTNKKE